MVYDEPVRYRLTQLIGNLSLLNVAGCQGIPVGHVTAHNATPSLQGLSPARTLARGWRVVQGMAAQRKPTAEFETLGSRPRRVVERST